MIFAFQFEQKSDLTDAFVEAVTKIDGVKEFSLSPEIALDNRDQPTAGKCRQLLVEIQESDAGRFWALVQNRLAQPPFEVLSSSMIVVCEGELGWQDYVLLQHYDKAQMTGSLS
jgi:hypothetical protein